MNRTTWTRRGLALVVAALMILSLLPAPAAQAITGDHLIVERYQPAGYENLSTVNSTSSTLEASSHGTFFKLNEAQTAPLYDWQLEWLCDDDLDAGWSTAFDEGITDPETPAWATVDLGKTAQLRRIVLFPVREEEYAANFPRALEIRLSDDNISWETAYTNGQVSASADEPLVVDLTELPTARYVQVYVTRRTDTPMTS
ncbi:MAG: discoidin domain-containing protein, partial [Clostridia bacterium]